MNSVVLSELQSIEAGLVCSLPSFLQDVISSNYSQITREIELCPICDADVVVSHHIWGFECHRHYNEQVKRELLLGSIWICPNCHYKIHTKYNPFWKGGYYDKI